MREKLSDTYQHVIHHTELLLQQPPFTSHLKLSNLEPFLDLFFEAFRTHERSSWLLVIVLENNASNQIHRKFTSLTIIIEPAIKTKSTMRKAHSVEW